MPITSIDIPKVGRVIPGFPHRAADLEENLQGTEAACVEARLSADTTSAEERAAFPEFNTPQKKKEFLYIRNQILSCWNTNPGQEVTLEAVTNKIKRIEYQNSSLIKALLVFLIRRGRINHGIFKEAPSKLPEFANRTEHIAIIGAGISGIIAARQLRYFGFKVTLFEGMHRLGGRICTYRESAAEGNQPWHAELGAQVVIGLPGNPIHTLSRQFRMDFSKIRNECNLYADGQPIKGLQASADKKAEEMFNKILEGILVLKESPNYKDKDYSLGDLVEKFIVIQEHICKENLLTHHKELAEKYEALAEVELKLSRELSNFKNIMVSMDQCAERKLKAESENTDDEACVYHYYFHRARIELVEQRKKYDAMVKQRDQLIEEIEKFEQNPPPPSFLTSFERRLLDWHIANLEYANATPINKLSMKHWDQDDSYEFPGDHYTITNGYDTIVNKLIGSCNDIEVKLGHKCNKIKLLESGKVELTVVEARYSKDLNPPKEKRSKPETIDVDQSDVQTTHTFDTVLCTVPLGVLKSKSIVFEPELPLWKQESIDKLGFGNLNKLVMHFDHRFWDDKIDMFGCLGPASTSRGEFYLFFSTSKQPVLTAILSGESANIAEDCSDDLIVRRVIIIMKEIFGTKNVMRPNLKSYRISRWSKNPFVKGAYSFTQVGSSGEDYDRLAAPMENGKSKVYFAGEHTNRHYPASVHGAYLSGLREAGRIADNYCPTPYKLNRAVRPEK